MKKKRQKRREFTEREDKIINTMYKTAGAGPLAELLGRTKDSIIGRAKRLKVERRVTKIGGHFVRRCRPCGTYKEREHFISSEYAICKECSRKIYHQRKARQKENERPDNS